MIKESTQELTQSDTEKEKKGKSTLSAGLKSNSKKSAKKENTEKTIKDVFEEELKDIYGAEKQLIEALPKMAEAAFSEELKEAILDHLEQTKEHAQRIELVFEMLEMPAEEKKCEAMEGLIEEGNNIIEEFESGNVRDCALIIGAQKIEHYEIASYGSLCELAEVQGMYDIAEILDETLEEEEMTDMLLTQIAETTNDEALDESEFEEESNQSYNQN
jgi:ferritin-like metal-binding protein YciE